MSRTEQPDALARAVTAAAGLRERNTGLLALLFGAAALFREDDSANGAELLEIAIDRTGSIDDFQMLIEALDEMEAGHV